MASLFEYHLRNSLNKAIEVLKTNCSTGNKGETEEQKSFNADMSKFMIEAQAEIQKMEINATTPNWDDVRQQLQEILLTKEQEALKRQSEIQSTGKVLNAEPFTNFKNKLLRIFDDLKLEVDKPHFILHRDQNVLAYTSSDVSISPFFNRFVNIVMDYRFHRTQERRVNNTTFTTKSTNKYELLVKKINAWQQFIHDHTGDLETYKDIVDGLLTNLIQKEANIQNQSNPHSYLGMARGIAGGLLSKFTEASDDLRVLLPDLQKAFIENCNQLPSTAEKAILSPAIVARPEESKDETTTLTPAI